MRLPMPKDDEIKRRLRGEQKDPVIMYIVVRKNTEFSLDQIAARAALAARECEALGLNDNTQKDIWQAWRSGSFRKVTLRAREGEWEKLKELEHYQVDDVIVLPPRMLSTREALLAKLQVMKNLNNPEPLPTFEGIYPGQLNLVIKSDLGMSDGKAIAQTCHAAMMSDQYPDIIPAVFGANTRDFETIIEKQNVRVVRDAGLTEIAPGSETVLAIET